MAKTDKEVKKIPFDVTVCWFPTDVDEDEFWDEDGELDDEGQEAYDAARFVISAIEVEIMWWDGSEDSVWIRPPNIKVFNEFIAAEPKSFYDSTGFTNEERNAGEALLEVWEEAKRLSSE